LKVGQKQAGVFMQFGLHFSDSSFVSSGKKLLGTFTSRGATPTMRERQGIIRPTNEGPKRAKLYMSNYVS